MDVAQEQLLTAEIKRQLAERVTELLHEDDIQYDQARGISRPSRA